MNIGITPSRLVQYINGIVNNAPVPKPYTRVEIMLNDIRNGDVVSISPKSSMEKYLAKISGADVELPIPQSRMDFYLAKIAGEDVDIPEPTTEIDRALDGWIESIEDYTELLNKAPLHIRRRIME